MYCFHKDDPIILMVIFFFLIITWNLVKTVNVLSAADMQQYESAMSWKAHDGEVYSVEFSNDENTVFSIGEDGKVCAC